MKLRTLNKYTYKSVFTVGIITALLASLMLMGMDLFTNIYNYMNYKANFITIVKLTLLYFPESFLLVIGPSFMFSVTYYLSMLHANNEIMGVLNSGVSFKRILRPCIILAFVLSIFYFGFNELVAINCSTKKEVLTSELTHQSQDKDNSNISIADVHNGYIVVASNYVDSTMTLYDVSVVITKEDDQIQRQQAYKAVYNLDNSSWTLYDVDIFTASTVDNHEVIPTHFDEYTSEIVKLEPQLFRNASDDIGRMDIKLAYSYLNRIKNLNPEQYADMGTDFYTRVFSCLTPMIMIIIACSMNYRFKKNVLFFSIICSICVAVVYYVIQMMTMLLAHQGVIEPQLGILLPFGAILVLSTITGMLLRRQ